MLEVDFEGVEQHAEHGESSQRPDDVDNSLRPERLVGGIESFLPQQMSEEEIADALSVSVPTIKRDWRKARAFLLECLMDSQ